MSKKYRKESMFRKGLLIGFIMIKMGFSMISSIRSEPESATGSVTNPLPRGRGPWKKGSVSMELSKEMSMSSSLPTLASPKTSSNLVNQKSQNDRHSQRKEKNFTPDYLF